MSWWIVVPVVLIMLGLSLWFLLRGVEAMTSTYNEHYQDLPARDGLYWIQLEGLSPDFWQLARFVGGRWEIVEVKDGGVPVRNADIRQYKPAEYHAA